MASISKINLNGTVYEIKDAAARGYSRLVGVTTTAITDGGVQVPTDLYGASATVASINVGDMVIYGNTEFIWAPAPKDGKNPDATGHPVTAHWHEFGAVQATSTAKSTTGISAKLASGAVSGTAVTIASDGAHTHTVSVSGEYTPAGTISGSAASASHTHSVKATGSVAVTSAAPASGKTANYTPAGTVSVTKGTLAGASHSHSYDKTTSITSAEGTADSHTFSAVKSVSSSSGKVTSSGSVDVPTVSATSVSFTAVNSNSSVTAVNASVSGEILTLTPVTATNTTTVSKSASSVTVGSTTKTVSSTSSNNFLTGVTGSTGYYTLTPNTTSTSTGNSGVSITGAPSGSFSGTGTVISATFTGDSVTTSAPSAAAPAFTFKGTGATISSTGTAASAGSHKHTASVTQGSVGTTITVTDPGHTHTINQQA